MYTAIQTWINARVTTLNGTISGTDNDLSEIETSFLTELNAAGESDKHYQVKIDGWQSSEGENIGIYLVDVVIELAFLIANDRDNYGNTITTYLQGLVRELNKRGLANVTSGGFTCYGMPYEDSLPVVSDANEFKDSHIYPKISLTVRVGDAN